MFTSSVRTLVCVAQLRYVAQGSARAPARPGRACSFALTPDCAVSCIYDSHGPQTLELGLIDGYPCHPLAACGRWHIPRSTGEISLG